MATSPINAILAVESAEGAVRSRSENANEELSPVREIQLLILNFAIANEVSPISIRPIFCVYTI